MNRLIHVLLCALCIGTLNINAQEIIPDPNESSIADHKMPASYSDTSEVWTYYFTDYGTDTVSYMNWSVRGDLKIVSSTSTSVTVCSYTTRSNNKDFAKGRIYASYYLNSTPPACGLLWRQYDVYKVFNDTTIELIGQECAKFGEVVTYSVDALVSHNINQEIGMDSYYWTYDNSLIDEILYFSGDSSSITFVADAIPDAGASLSVTVGQKNVPLSYSTYTKNIKSGVDSVSFISGYEPNTCLPITASSINDTLIVDAQNGVLYHWDFDIYDAVYISAIGDTLIYRPNEASETITLSVEGGCETKVFEYKTNRSLTPELTDITIPGQTLPYCLNPETSYAFELTNVSSSERIEWDIEGDWTGLALMNTTTPNMKTGVERAIITANTASCPNVTVVDTFIVKPQTPGEITGNTCISAGADTNTYSVVAQSSADSYTWEYPIGWTITGDATGNSITFTTDGSIGTLRVRANGCENSNWSSLEISKAANRPVVESEPSCIETHISNTFGVSIVPIAGETYTWILPSCLTLDNITSATDSITVSTNTYETINDSILVFASTGCGNSDTTVIQIRNIEGTFDVNYNAVYSSVFEQPVYNFDKVDVPNSSIVNTYLIINDTLYDDIRTTDAGLVLIDVANVGHANNSDDIVNYSGWAFIIDYNLSNGCLCRYIYGDSNYSYEDVDYIISSNSTLKSASISSLNKEEGDIIIYPNPMLNKVTLKLDNETDSEKVYTIYNILGKVVFTEKTKSNKIKVNTQSWPGGTYLAGIKVDGKVYKSTLVKK